MLCVLCINEISIFFLLSVHLTLFSMTKQEGKKEATNNNKIHIFNFLILKNKNKNQK